MQNYSLNTTVFGESVLNILILVSKALINFDCWKALGLVEVCTRLSTSVKFGVCRRFNTLYRVRITKHSSGGGGGQRIQVGDQILH